MKNVKETWLKKCICISNEDFERILKDAFPDKKINVDYSLDGMSIDLDGVFLNNEDSNFLKQLANYFDVDKITSIHIDDCDYPIGVWIVIKEKEDR